MTLINAKRFQQAMFEVAASANRAAGSGGGSGLIVTSSLGLSAGGNQGGYSTANSSTWADITNTSFSFSVGRACFFEYRLFITAQITAGAAQGYVRGNIVGFDVTASPWFAGANVQNGFMWYYPASKGPIQPGNYTAKLQAATDANTTTLTVQQFFHQFFLFGGL